MNSRILITGATGNVGREVIRVFPEKSLLRAAVSDMGRACDNQIEHIHFNFEDAATYPSALQDVRSVFLMRPPQISNVKKYIAPVIDAAQAAGVEHIVFLSIVGVDKNPLVPHHKIENLLRASGMDWTFLRASFFMQNLNTTHREEIGVRGEIAVPVGKSKTSFIDVRDIGAIGAKALTEPGYRNHAYTLTGSEALDYFQIADTMTSVLGKPIRYVNPSLPRFVRAQLTAGRPLGFTLVMSALYTLTRFGTAATVTQDTENLLGRPPILFRQYVEDYCHAWE
ncbi:MAG: SDR family oxidoreductase [Chloroflexota bacterium]